LINDILQEVSHKFVLVFFDDILNYSQTWDEHLSHIAQVFHIV
jgi:hypothetical protein